MSDDRDIAVGVTGTAQIERAADAPLTERLRYLATFADHAGLAVALRCARRPPSPPALDGRRLRVALLSMFPPAHLGTVSRFTRWLPHLERLGCDVEILTPCSDAQFAAFGRGDAAADQRYYHACIWNQWRNVRHAARADVAVLHRGLLPLNPWQRPTFERQLARLNPHLVYDFYDAIWLQREEASRQASRIGRWLHPPDKIDEIVQLSRVVTVSNERLAEWARHRHDDVRVLPMLVSVADYEQRRHEARSPVVLGWNGNRHQIPRLLSLAPALRRVAAIREIVLRVISSEDVEVPGVPVESHTHPWSLDTEHADFAGLDVGLLPLEDIAHDRGKSPFKLLQYSAAGLGIVAAPVAVDESVLRPGECFLPATSEDEWVENLTRLVDDASLRARLGGAAREAVLQNYSFESYADAFLDALLTAAGATKAA